jgi:PAS domain S-box-containing protein
MTLYADEVFHHLLTLGQKSEILNLLPMAAYVVRSDGVVIWYNERAAALWGRRPDAGDTDERFCGAHTLYHADGSHMAHCDTPVALALQTGVSVHQEEVIIGRPDKSRVHVSVYIDPIRNPENGEIIGVVNFFHDLTERKRQEAERDSLLREAEARSGELRKAREELESKVKERTISLQQLSARLMSVQDDERRHIARELHDSIGQYLMALGLTLTQLERAKPSNVPARFAECKEILTRCVDETRTLSYLLHPPLLDEIGLESATKMYVEEFEWKSIFCWHGPIDFQLRPSCSCSACCKKP